MSRAFIKENDLEHAGIDIPERPISSEKNYVTPTGLENLKNTLNELDKERQFLIAAEESLAKEGSDIDFTLGYPGKEELSVNNSNINQQKMRIERDIRYISARLKSAILVNPLTQNKETVLFSARVEVLASTNNKQYFHIVGEDEANFKENKISYLSPLSKLLIGSRINDEVVWNKPSGNEILTITNIYYCGQTNPKSL